MKKRAEHIQVLSLKSPFSMEKTESLFQGKTRLSEIIQKSLQEKSLIDRASVWIYDKEMRQEPLFVSPKDYGSIIVKENTIVTLRVCPTGGGGGGGKNVLKIVATIALVVVSAYFGPALGAAILPTGTATATATAVGVGLINVVGALAINALIPPPTGQFDSRGSLNAKESPTLSITGSQNRANPYGVVPRVFGRYKVYPTIAAQAYSEIAGNEQYLRLLFDFGYGELELSDMKIGNRDLSDFDDVETEIRYGLPSDSPFKLYSKQIDESPQSIKVSYSGGAQIITTSQNSNEGIVDAVFQGLVSISDDGTNQDHTVDIKYEYRLSSGGGWTVHGTVSYTNKTRQPYYISRRIQFPSADQYDIRITRMTEDTSSELIFDEFIITSIKSVTDSPPVNVTGRCMVAMRIRATEQLNGVVDQFNAIAQAKLPVWNGSSWTSAVVTRNPAWAYAEVLRGAANGNPVNDSLIDGDGIKAWADACDAAAQDGQAKWTFDAVVDYSTTVFELLRDIATAGRASFAMVNGKYSIIQDLPQSIPIQHFTPRNSWGFSSTKVFADAIHGIKCRWINPDRDWQQDEVIAYDDGYDSSNASKFASLQIWGATRKNQAWREGRYALAVARLRPEVYSLSCDIENLICTRGDLVRVTHDVASWGQKGARIKALTLNGGSECTHVTLDEEVTMEAGKTYNLRLRSSMGTSSVQAVVLNVAIVTQVEFVTPISTESVPSVGDLVMFGETNLESVELIVQTITPSKDLTATLTLVDAAPAIHNADTGAIPVFDPKITSVPNPIRALPDPPLILDFFSDEDALQVNTDGSTSPRIIIDIAPQPQGTTVPRTSLQIRYKESSDLKYKFLSPFEGTQTRFFLDEVVTGKKYDVGIRSVSLYGETSAWVSRLGYQVIGRTTPPSTVSNFTANIVQEECYLSWTPNTEADIDYYIIRFSPDLFATYENAVELFPKVSKHLSGVTAPARTGSYHIKAVDTLKLKSLQAASKATIFDSIKNVNLIETITESPDFLGERTNVSDTDIGLVLSNVELWDDRVGNIDDWLGMIDAGGGGVVASGSYGFSTVFDSGAIYTHRVTVDNLDVKAVDYSNSFDALIGLLDDLEGDWDLLTGFVILGLFDEYTENIDDFAGTWDELTRTGAFETNVRLQVSVTDNNPSASPKWSAWQDLVMSELKCRGMKFQLLLESSNGNQTPRVETCSLKIDMPDRVDSTSGVSSGVDTLSVGFSPAFKFLKEVGITASNLASGDYYVKSNESVTGFDITFYNSSDLAIDRIFGWTAHGYGHLVT